MLANLLFSAVISSGIETVTPAIDWDLPRLQVDHKKQSIFLMRREVHEQKLIQANLM